MEVQLHLHTFLVSSKPLCHCVCVFLNGPGPICVSAYILPIKKMEEHLAACSCYLLNVLLIIIY